MALTSRQLKQINGDIKTLSCRLTIFRTHNRSLEKYQRVHETSARLREVARALIYLNRHGTEPAPKKLMSEYSELLLKIDYLLDRTTE